MLRKLGMSKTEVLLIFAGAVTLLVLLLSFIFLGIAAWAKPATVLSWLQSMEDDSPESVPRSVSEHFVSSSRTVAVVLWVMASLQFIRAVISLVIECHHWRQVIPPIGAEGLNRRPPAGSCRLFLGPGFRLGARWNRLVETVKTRKKREKTGKKWARYGLKRAKEGANQGSTGSWHPCCGSAARVPANAPTGWWSPTRRCL